MGSFGNGRVYGGLQVSDVNLVACQHSSQSTSVVIESASVCVQPDAGRRVLAQDQAISQYSETVVAA